MPLRDLNEELYKRDSYIAKRTHKGSQFYPSNSSGTNAGRFQEEEWIKPEKGLKNATKKLLKIGGIIAAIGVILAGGYWLFVRTKQASFSEDRVTISIDGPNEIDSNEAVVYKIKYKNNNRAALKDAEILLNYGENFRPQDGVNLKQEGPQNSRIYIGEIKSNGEGIAEVRGNFYAPKDYVVYLSATLQYKSSNFNSVFIAKNQLGINVKSSPIFLEITAPLDVASGNNVEYIIDYKNLSNLDFNDLRIKADYPDAFEVKNSDPRPSDGNNFWFLGTLGPGQGGKIKIEGIIRGSRNESKIISVSVGVSGSDGQFVVYNESDKNTKIVASPLSITQTVNGSSDLNVNPGEKLDYQVIFRNDGEIGVRDAIINVEIKSSIVDFSKLSLSKGHFDSARGVITWKAADAPELTNLGPGQGGKVEFSVPVLQNVPVKNSQDKNFTIESVAKIDSPDIPTPTGSNKVIASNTLSLKLKTEISFENPGYYKDANIANTGPVPSQVGKETTYTLHWMVSSNYNDVSDVRIVSSLPTGVKWTGKLYPEGEKVIYNERTNQIIWEVGNVESATGILKPKREIAFQVSITPGINQVGKPVKLISSATLTGKDMFTSLDLTVETKEKDTSLTEDTSISKEGYTVINSL